MINGPRVATCEAVRPSVLQPKALTIKTSSPTPYSRPPRVAGGPSGTLRRSRKSPDLELLSFLRDQQVHRGL